ncbi:hypothetical protein [Deferrisoma palaeochoriense]
MKRIVILTALIALLGVAGLGLAAPAAADCGCNTAKQATPHQGLEPLDLLR